MPPEARIRIGDCDIQLVGTIAGFVADAERVKVAFETLRPERVALGVPPEDLDTLRTLATHEHPAALIGPNEQKPGKRGLHSPGAGAAGIEAMLRPASAPLQETDAPPNVVEGLDALSARFLELLAVHGAVRLPSPDLEAAWKCAAGAGVAVEALDLDDDTHAAYYARQVGFFGLVRRQRIEAKLLKETVTAAEPYALAAQWDARVNAPRALARVEEERERHMALRVREVAARCHRLLAVVPAARFAGVLGRLGAGPQT